MGDDSAIRNDAQRAPHVSRLSPDRLDYDAIMQAHDEAVERCVNGYHDPKTGAFVFTVAALMNRGTCCASGCRHCPYVGVDDSLGEQQ